MKLCTKCGKAKRRTGQRYCAGCHAAAQAGTRARRREELQAYRKGDRVRMPDGKIAICLGSTERVPIRKPNGKLL